MTPTDDDFDDMHHALGRPKTSKSESYRNHYCVAADSDTARRFEALGLWDFGRRINGGRDAVYHVNEAGKQALAAWLDARHPRIPAATPDADRPTTESREPNADCAVRGETQARDG